MLRHQLRLLIRFSGFVGVEPADLLEIGHQVERRLRDLRRLLFQQFLGCGRGRWPSALARHRLFNVVIK